MYIRVDRDGWLKGKRVNACCADARDLLLRLEFCADNQGAFEADMDLLLSNAYPRGTPSEEDAERWLHELVERGLVTLYHNNGDRFGYVIDYPATQEFRTTNAPKCDHPAPDGGFQWRPCHRFDEYRAWVRGDKVESSRVGGRQTASERQAKVTTPRQSAPDGALSSSSSSSSEDKSAGADAPPPTKKRKKKQKGDKPKGPNVYSLWLDCHDAMGRPRPVSSGKETAASKRISDWAVSNMIDVEHVKWALWYYLEDSDNFIVKNGHSLALLPDRIAEYVHRRQLEEKRAKAEGIA